MAKKKGKKEVKKLEGETVTKSEIKKENKQLKTILSVIGILLLSFLLILLINYRTTNFKYEDVKFKIIREGDLIFYNTFLNTYSGEEVVGKYNFYLRKDPRKLEEVPFEGEVSITPNTVINITEDFHCEGDGIIAVANLVNLLEFMGVKVIQDPEASCEVTGKYTFIKILPGDETKIEQYGLSCYRIYINDCEILEGTEKFMVETFVEINKLLSE